MADPPAGCARTTGAVVGEQPATATPTVSPTPQKEAPRMTARVGQKAPDFEAPAYYRGCVHERQALELPRQVGPALLLPR